MNLAVYVYGVWWRIGGVDAFRPESPGFESHLNRSNSDLGQVLHLQLPIAFQHVNSDTVSIAVVGSTSERLML